MGQGQFHSGINGFIILIFYNITLNIFHWMVFNFFFFCDSENDLKFAMHYSTKFQRIDEHCQHIRKHYQCIRKRLQHVGKNFNVNGLKYVVTHFQCIFNFSYARFSQIGSHFHVSSTINSILSRCFFCHLLGVVAWWHHG